MMKKKKPDTTVLTTNNMHKKLLELFIFACLNCFVIISVLRSCNTLQVFLPILQYMYKTTWINKYVAKDIILYKMWHPKAIYCGAKTTNLYCLSMFHPCMLSSPVGRWRPSVCASRWRLHCDLWLLELN